MSPTPGAGGAPSARRRGGRCRRVETALLLLSAAASCQDPGLSLEDVRGRGFLRAGYSDEPPYAFVDSSGRITGESPEALRAAAAALGIEDIRWVRLDFRDLVPALEQGRIDVVAAGMYGTPEREQRVRFSRPTVCSGPALVVRSGDRRFREILEARDSAAPRVAVLPGSVEQQALRIMGVPEDRVILTPDVRTGLLAVEEGEADALAITAPTARRLAGRDARAALEVVPYEPPRIVEHLLRACSALAFRPADARLAASLDSALVDVLRSRERRHLVRSYGFSEEPHGRDTLRPGKP